MKTLDVNYRMVLTNLAALLFTYWLIVTFAVKDTSFLGGVLIVASFSYVVGLITGWQEGAERWQRTDEATQEEYEE